MTQILALNYGSKDEIVRAVKKISLQNLEINEQNITNNLDTKDIPSVDMLIRTSGEIRISNFMLWQSAYAEMFFTDTYWPDFTSFELDDLIDDFTSRNRRFGAL
jgi:undecaprenyl diphosphate synthase